MTMKKYIVYIAVLLLSISQYSCQEEDPVEMTFEDVYKNSLLHIAISYNQYNICKYLIEEGIDINHVNLWYMTPLEQSIHMKFNKISELLRKHNAYYKNQLTCYTNVVVRYLNLLNT